MVTTTVDDAVIEARVRRALAMRGEQLRISRPGSREEAEFGRYWTADIRTGNPERWPLDLDDLARETGVMRPGERMTG